MNPFFHDFTPEDALALADLSRHLYELREARKSLLAQAQCPDAEALLAAIEAGTLPDTAREAHRVVLAIEAEMVEVRTAMQAALAQAKLGDPEWS